MHDKHVNMILSCPDAKKDDILSKECSILLSQAGHMQYIYIENIVPVYNIAPTQLATRLETRLSFNHTISQQCFACHRITAVACWYLYHG